MKEFVRCKRCIDWSITQRQYNICKLCNNSKFVKNPKLIRCNNCDVLMCGKGDQYPYGLYNSMVSGSCFSPHLTDLVNYEFSLCEECLRKMFNGFKNPPTVSGFNSPSSYKEDNENYEYNIWRKTGAYKKAYLDRKCNNAKNCQNDAVYMINDHYGDNLCCCEEHVPNRNNPNYVLTEFVPNELKLFK